MTFATLFHIQSEESMKTIVLARQVKIEDDIKCDFNGIEAAVRLKAKTGCHVQAIVLGYEGGCVQQVRDAVAMGCDCGRAVVVPNLSELDAWSCAKIFSEILKTEAFDIVVCGGFPIDADTVAAGLLAAELAGLTFVSHAEDMRADNGEENRFIEVDRRTDNKLEILKVKLPCLISALPHPEDPIYKTVPGINRAYAMEIPEETWEASKEGNKILVAESIKAESRKRGALLTATSTEEAVRAVIEKITSNHLL